MEPVTVVLVDSLATNFDFDVLDKSVSDPVDPSEVVTALSGDTREFNLEVDSVD